MRSINIFAFHCLSDFCKSIDYVYTPHFQGVYWNKGIILDVESDEDDFNDEWKNKIVRESKAKSSLIKVKRTSSGTFFTRGKLNEIGQYLKSLDHVDVVFINTMLTPMQIKKLQQRFRDFLENREERLRRYYIRSANKTGGEPTDLDSDSGFVTGEEISKTDEESRIKVLDRFGIILYIFAQRAQSNLSKFQIELAWLDFARTNLVRGSGPSFGRLGNLFGGNLEMNEEVEIEVVSAKQRGSSGRGGLQGAGETQLELERRNINNRKAELKRLIAEENKRRESHRNSRLSKSRSVPLVALVGYTNVGKTTIMNKLTSEELGVEDRLFHTLTTTVRKFQLKGNQRVDLIDTIGFISHLPHTLVESFKSTLEEILYADILLHVRDISHPNSEYQKDTVLNVLNEIGVSQNLMK